MISARFGGTVGPGALLKLAACFLGPGGQRVHLYEHRSRQVHACRHTPITTLAAGFLLDSNEAPPIELAAGDRFTVLVFADGAVVAAATYAFDGQRIVEAGQVGSRVEMQDDVAARPAAPG
jgi:hypothetical protein